MAEQSKRIVILGAGFGGTYTYRGLHRALHRRRDIAVTIITRDNYFLFTPMLHEVATGGLRRSNLVQAIRYIIGCCQAELVVARVEGIDCEHRLVRTSLGSYNFDYAVIALGAETNFFQIPGAAEHTWPLKTMPDASRLRHQLLTCLEVATTERDPLRQRYLLRWVVVGGGPTGVELAAELTDLARSYAKAVHACPIQFLEVILYQSAEALLPMFDERMQRMSRRMLEAKGVRVRLGVRVTEVHAGGVKSDREGNLAASTVIWTAGIQPSGCDIAPAGLTDEHGQIVVTPALTLSQFPYVFALGDIAAIPSAPQTAQAAVAEARCVAENLMASIDGRALHPFTFKKSGDLVSVGQWQAIGVIQGFFIHGRFTWWLWRTVYLTKLIGFPSKLRVAVDWTLDLFFPRDISRID